LKVNLSIISSSKASKVPFFGWTSKTPYNSKPKALISKYQLTLAGLGFEIKASMYLSFLPPSYY